MISIKTNRAPTLVPNNDPEVVRPPNVVATDNEIWITETQAAERLNVSVKWLQKKRYVGGGIPFLKIENRMIRYRMADIYEFEMRSLRNNTSQ